MNTRKFLTTLGKILIIACLLWPVPVGFILFPVFNSLWDIPLWGIDKGLWGENTADTIMECIRFLNDMPLWGIKHGYWWPLLGIMALGIILCVVANYKGVVDYSPSKESSSPISVILGLIFWTLIGIGGFMALILLIIGFYYLFFTEAIMYAVPIMLIGGLCAFLIWLGIRFYKENNSEK